MSLDERLRNDLRTLADPTDNTELQLAAFRRNAYPRRTRRRVLESVGSVLAAAAIIAGGTAVVRTLSNRPAGYAARPPGMPTCSNENLHLSTGLTGGPTMAVETALNAVRTPCWVDVRVRLTITRNGSTDQSNAEPLPIEGNGSIIRLRGVVPVGPIGHPSAAANVLGVRWAWSNWCGHVKSMFFEFKPLGSGFSYINSLGYGPTIATCVDKSKPSVLRPLGQVNEMNDATPFPS